MHFSWLHCQLSFLPEDLNEIVDNNFKQILMVDGSDTSCEVVLRWMSLELTGDVSRLVSIGLVTSGSKPLLEPM